jgi:hypothetical protein
MDHPYVLDPEEEEHHDQDEAAYTLHAQPQTTGPIIGVNRYFRRYHHRID